MVLVDVHETAINRRVLCKQYASTERNIEVFKHFMVFENFIYCSHYPCSVFKDRKALLKAALKRKRPAGYMAFLIAEILNQKCQITYA